LAEVLFSPRLRQAFSVAPQCLRFASALRGNGAEITSLVVLVPPLRFGTAYNKRFAKILKIFLRFAQKFSELRKSPPRWQ